MQREYGMDLIAALPAMTWRRFMVLVRGLSTHSALASRIRADRFTPTGAKREQVREMRTPDQSQRAFEMIFGPPPARVS